MKDIDPKAELDKFCDEAHRLAQAILVMVVNDVRGPGAAIIGLELALQTVVIVQRAMYGGDPIVLAKLIASLKLQQKDKLEEIRGQLLDFMAQTLKNHSDEKN